MPIFRYFLVVGVCLTGVILALNAMLPHAWSPNLATEDSNTAAFDRTQIRIAGTEKKMQPVIIDTSLPTIAPPPVTIQAQAESQNLHASVREARAEVPKIEPANIAPARTPKKKKVIARRRIHSPAPHFNRTPRVAGLFGGPGLFSDW